MFEYDGYNSTEELVENYFVYLSEMDPFRSGYVPMEIGRTSFNGLQQDCILLNKLRFLFRFSPSFALIIPNIDLLKKISGGTNGFLIPPIPAQNMEFEILETGKCLALTHFFGRKNERRTFDMFFRLLSEKGFSIRKPKDLKTFPESAELDITAQKKDFYKTYTSRGKSVKGVSEKVPVRIKRVK